jgi:hypothetical protein
MRRYVLMTVLALALQATPAWACTCGDRSSPINEFKGSTAVFTGTAVAIEVPGGSTSFLGRFFWSIWYSLGFGSPPDITEPRITFEVHDAWKGVTKTTVEVTTSQGCEYPFVIGNAYLVYAPGGSVLETSRCQRTQPAAMSAQDEAFLKTMPVTAFSTGSARSTGYSYVGVVLGSSVVFLLMLEWIIRRRRSRISGR